MSKRAPRALRQKVMLPLLAIGILSAVAIAVMAYLSIEAQLMRQLRYRAVQIIDTVAEGNLRERQTEADPVGREVIDVIKINATNREIAKLLKRGGAFYVGEDPVGLGRFESERNKPGKPTGLILQLAELAQMIDAMSRRFDVPVEHGASAAAAHFVPSAMNVEPFSSGFFPATNRVTNLRIENLRATAGY